MEATATARRTRPTKQRLAAGLIGLAALASPAVGLAAPITFLTALPVARGRAVLRLQGVFMTFDDETALDRSLAARAFPVALVYGATPRLAVFAVVPVVDKELELSTPAGRLARGTTGLGDVTLLARYTLYQRDSRSGTLRIAPFAGVEAPTGDDDETDDLDRLPQPLQLGSGSWDPKLGVVLTRQTLGWQLDTALSYQANTEANDFAFGDELRWDVSYQHRVWPRRLGGGVPAFLYLVLESNLITQGRDEVDGLEDPDSGGTVWFLAPGIQYVTRRVVVEGAVQVPAAQSANGLALERDLVAVLSFRLNL